MSIRAIRYELNPTAEQKQKMRSACGCVRFVHNYMLDVQCKHYEATGKFIPYPELDREFLTPLKKQNGWLREPSKWALQYACRSLCENIFTFKKNGRGFPKFKKKGRCKEAIHIQESLNIDYDNWTCRIAKVGNVRIYKGHNKRIGNIHSYTIEVKPSLDRYFISIMYEDSADKPFTPCAGSHVGIDVGIKTFATLSDGTVFENQKHLKSNLRKLRVLQRSAARKYKRGVRTENQSKNWHKAQKRIAKLQFKVSNQRQDYLHKVSTWIAKNYSTVCVETLNVKGMVKNHHLAQAVSDCGWGAFIGMLAYKCEDLVKIDKWYASSQTCSECGYVNKGVKDLSVRKWVCPECGTIHDRDLNAARNIEREGLSLCGLKVSGYAVLAPRTPFL